MDQNRSRAAGEKFCSTCGSVIKQEAEICPECGVRQMAPLPVVSQDGADFFIKFVTFIFPIIGLILYFVWIDTKPRAAKEVGKWAIISVVTMVVVIIAVVVVLIAAGLSLGGRFS
jgi:hypothetical protein